MAWESLWTHPKVGSLVLSHYHPALPAAQRSREPHPAIILAVDRRIKPPMVVLAYGTSQRVDSPKAYEVAITPPVSDRRGLNKPTKFDLTNVSVVSFTSELVLRAGSGPYVLGQFSHSDRMLFVGAYVAAELALGATPIPDKFPQTDRFIGAVDVALFKAAAKRDAEVGLDESARGESPALAEQTVAPRQASGEG